MSLEGVDYSFGRPGGAALAKAGKRFAMRYVGTNDGKSIAAAELDDLQSHGIAVGFVFETSAARALSDLPGGKADGQRALNALTVLGAPDDRPVYFAVDFDAMPSQYDVIESYLTGAGTVLGKDRVGVYAHARFVNVSSAASWFWQTYAWSAGQVSPRAHLLQYRNGQTINGAAVDLCRSFAADFGAWSKEDPVLTTITVLPYGGGTFVIPANTQVTSFSIGATGIVAGPTFGPVANPSQAHYDATVTTDATRGGPFLRVVDGALKGFLIAAAKVTATPNPAPAPSVQQLADARAAGYEDARTKALAAVGGI